MKKSMFYDEEVSRDGSGDGIIYDCGFLCSGLGGYGNGVGSSFWRYNKDGNGRGYELEYDSDGDFSGRGYGTGCGSGCGEVNGIIFGNGCRDMDGYAYSFGRYDKDSSGHG